MSRGEAETYTRVDSAGRARLVGLGRSPDRIMAARFGSPYLEYRRAWEAAGRFEETPPAPLHLDVDTNYSCNLSCAMCPLGAPGFPVEYQEKRLSADMYRRVLSEGAENGLAAVRLGITGEPLLRKDIVDFVSAAADLGLVDIMLITNGMLLDEPTAAGLIEAGLTRLMVSIDAVTPDTYRTIRCGGNLETVIRNVESFLALRKRMGRALPLLRVSFVRTALNVHEQQAFKDYWTGRAEYVSFQEYSNILESPRTRLFAEGVETPSDFRCPDPWQRMSLFVNGDYFPCCSDFGRLAPVGNAKDVHLTEAWNSRRTRDLRRLHRDGLWERSSVCRRCVAARTPEE